MRNVRDERGIAMVVAVLVMLILATMAIGVSQLTSHELGNSAYNIKRDQAIQAAQAGVDSYIAKLQNLVGNAVCTTAPAGVTTTLSSSPLVTYSVNVAAYAAGSSTNLCPSSVNNTDLQGGRIVVTGTGVAGSSPQQVTRKWQTVANLATVYSNQNIYAVRAGVHIEISGSGVVRAYANCQSLPSWPAGVPCANNASFYSAGDVNWGGNFQLEGSLSAAGNITLANGYIWGNVSSGGNINWSGTTYDGYVPAPSPLLTYSCDSQDNVGIGNTFPVVGAGNYPGNGWAIYPCFGNVTATGSITWTGAGRAYGSCTAGAGVPPFTAGTASKCTRQPKVGGTTNGSMPNCGQTSGTTWGSGTWASAPGLFPFNDTAEPCGKVVSPAPAPPTAPPDPQEVWSDALLQTGCPGSYPCYTISNYDGSPGAAGAAVATTTNNATGAINASNTSVTVTEVAGAPAAPFVIYYPSEGVGGEKLLVTSKACVGLACTYQISRAYGGVPATSHSKNDGVSLWTGMKTCGAAQSDILGWTGGGSAPGWNNAAAHADNAVHVTTPCSFDFTNANMSLRGNLIIATEGNYRLDKANVSSATGANQCTGGLPGYLGDQCTFALIVPYSAGRACGPMTPGVLGPYGYTSAQLTNITTVNLQIYTQCDVSFANSANTTGQIFGGRVDMANNGSLAFVPTQIPFIKPVPSGYTSAPIYFRECFASATC